MTRKTTTVASIEVYWNSQDPSNEGWAYRMVDAAGRERSGPVDADPDDLDDAIREACRLEGLDLTPDLFAQEPLIDGGWAIYSAPEDPQQET